MRKVKKSAGEMVSEPSTQLPNIIYLSKAEGIRMKYSMMPKFNYAILATCSLFTFVFFYLSPIDAYKTSDPFGSLLVSQSYIEFGTPYLDNYEAEVIDVLGWQKYENNERIYYSYPIGSSILSIPAVFVANICGYDMRLKDNQVELQRLICPLIVSLCFVILFFINSHYFRFKKSLILAGVFTFGTTIASCMGNALYNLNYSVLCILLSLLILIKNKQYNFFYHLILGLLLFTAYICRPSTALFILSVFTYLLFTKNIKALLLTGLSSFILFVLFVSYSFNVYGDYYPGNYGSDGFALSSAFLGTLYGHLLSPSRGLLIFSPIFIATLLGGLFYFKRLSRNSLFCTIAVWTIAHLACLSCWIMWWGGGSYGYRLLTDALPGYILLTILVLKEAESGPTKLKFILSTIFSVFAVISVLIHGLQGSYNTATSDWHQNPNVDANPHFVYDWRVPQFLACDLIVKKKELIHQQATDVIQLFPTQNLNTFSGWGNKEMNHDRPFIWSLGKSSNIEFPYTNEMSKIHSLVINGNTFQKQLIRIFLNEKEIGSFKGNGLHQDLTQKFPFNKSLIKNKNKIIFIAEGPIAPKDIDPNSNDDRELGLKIDQLYFEIESTSF